MSISPLPQRSVGDLERRHLRDVPSARAEVSYDRSIVFSLPAQIADIAYQNKAVIYDILFKASAETLITIAADPKHLGACIGMLSVLHTWGSGLTQNPHSDTGHYHLLAFQ